MSESLFSVGPRSSPSAWAKAGYMLVRYEDKIKKELDICRPSTRVNVVRRERASVVQDESTIVSDSESVVD